jgi:hypothetical protein
MALLHREVSVPEVPEDKGTRQLRIKPELLGVRVELLFV